MKKIKITVRTKSVPYQDPFSVYKKHSNNGNDVSLLMESRSLNLRYGRRSIVVPHPCLKIVGKDSTFCVEALNPFGQKLLKFFGPSDFRFADTVEYASQKIAGQVTTQHNHDSEEKNRLKQRGLADVLHMLLSKFSCSNSYVGLYGAISYDFAKQYYPVTAHIDEKLTDDFVFFVPTQIFTFHDIRKTAEVLDLRFNNLVDKTHRATRGYDVAFKKKKTVSYDLSEQAYLKRVRSIIRDIKKGRAMQCVLSRSMQTPVQKSPLDSYAALRTSNPAPYSFFFNVGNNEILYGASPERHIAIQSGEIEIRPIAGTARRSPRALDDARARIGLLTDTKEIREHTMLVDLARHELYSICTSDSVNVSDLFTLEQYPNLYHLVSGVTGTLRPGVDAISALLVTLPAGTLSGAPKREAMQMIEEYEGSNRGYYGGAIGYLAFNGDCNTGITIRSVYVKGSTNYVRAGGGVVVLSTPQGELAETKLKSEKMREVLSK